MSESKTTAKNIFKNPKNRMPLIAIAVLLCLGLLGAGFLGWQRSRDENSSNNSQNSLSLGADQGNNGGNAAGGEFKFLAEKRLEKLTNGLKIEEISRVAAAAELPESQKAQADMAVTGSPGMAYGRGAAVAQTGSKDMRVALDSEKAEKLIQDNQVSDNTVFFTEVEMQDDGTENGAYSWYFRGRTGLNRQEPIRQKTWYSANYSKTVVFQGEQILNLNISTPEYFLDYQGGNYALRENFSQNQYFGGLGFGCRCGGPYGGSSNWEVEFLKSILADQNIKDLGMQEIDGKMLQVLETDPNASVSPLAAATEDQKMMAPAANWKMRYYVDMDNFSLYLTENYENGELKHSLKTIESQELTDVEPSQIFTPEEIRDKEIKQIQQSQTKPEDFTLGKFLQKYPILYDLENLNQNTFYTSDNAAWQEEEGYKLRNSRDFNPSLEERDLTVNQNQPLAYFSQVNSKYSSFNIYRSKPNASKIDPRIYEQEQGPKPQEEIITKPVSLQIDGQNVNGEYVQIATSWNNLAAQTEIAKPESGQTTTPAQTDPTAPTTGQAGPVTAAPARMGDNGIMQDKSVTNYLYFNYQNLWFEAYLNLAGESSLEKLPTTLSFKTLKATEAAQIDAANLERQEAFPRMEPTKLAQIDQEIRLLPGDLSTSHGLVLGYANKSSKTEKLEACGKFIEYIYSIMDCLPEQYRGFGLSFNQSAPSAQTGTTEPGALPARENGPADLTMPSKLPESEKYKNLELRVLNTRLADLDLQQIADQLKLKPENGNINLVNDNQKNTYTISDPGSRLVFLEVKGKTVIIGSINEYNGLSESEQMQIAQNMDFDKDLDILEDQLASGGQMNTYATTRKIG